MRILLIVVVVLCAALADANFLTNAVRKAKHKVILTGRKLFGFCPSEPVKYEDLRVGLDRDICHQPLATHIIAESLSGHFLSNPEAPLLMVWQGGPGVGKSTAVNLLRDNSFANVKIFTPTPDSTSVVDALLLEAAACPRTLFIFDDADLMPPRLLTNISTLVTGPHAARLRHAVFIFIINIGLSSIERYTAAHAADFATSHFSVHEIRTRTGFAFLRNLTGDVAAYEASLQRRAAAFSGASGEPPAAAGVGAEAEADAEAFARAVARDTAPATHWLGRTAPLPPAERRTAKLHGQSLRWHVERAVIDAGLNELADAADAAAAVVADADAATVSGAAEANAPVTAFETGTRSFFNSLVTRNLLSVWVPFVPIDDQGRRCCTLRELQRLWVALLPPPSSMWWPDVPTEDRPPICRLDWADPYPYIEQTVRDAMFAPGRTGVGAGAQFSRGGCRGVASDLHLLLNKIIDAAARKMIMDRTDYCIHVTVTFEDDEPHVVAARIERPHGHDEL